MSAPRQSNEPPDQSFVVEFVCANDLTDVHHLAWQNLADHALDANVFYEPGFALSALGHLPGTASVRVGFVWQGTVDERTPIAVIPVEFRRRWPLFYRASIGWRHPFVVLTNPLLAPGFQHMALRAFFDHLRLMRTGPRCVISPLLADTTPTGRAIRELAETTKRRIVATSRQSRAMLMCDAAHSSLAGISSKRHKELRRQKRRLAESGEITRVTAFQGSELAEAIDDFLALETSGWKGRAGIAARQQHGAAGFLRSAVTQLGGEGKARVDRLLLADELIASTITLRSRDRGSLWKIAYSERYAGQAPGVQLLYDVSTALAADPGLISVDSCAVEGHRLIESLWRDRMALADVHVFVRPNESPFIIHLCTASERARRWTLEQARKGYQAIRAALEWVQSGRTDPTRSPASSQSHLSKRVVATPRPSDEV
jgi:CelD/BcsL family acetyltransferase involved in cellulose biosynthesis